MAIPHFDAAAIAAATPWPALIDAIGEAFVSPHHAPDRHIHEIEVPGAPDATALLMPAWLPGEVYGVKLANIFPGNSDKGLPSISALYVLFDGTTGQPLATMDGAVLTARRTAATSALASRHLSRADSSTLLMVGSGKLAPMLIEAHRAVRPIEQVLVWGRDPAKAAALGEAVTDLNAAAGVADIVSAATLSREPLVHGAALRPGTHLDLVGAYKHDRREADGDAVARASVFIDTEGGAKAEAGDLILAIGEGWFAWDRVKGDLADLVSRRHPGRTSRDEITLFKSVGAAIEDLAAARLVLAGAR